jgi:HAMP domain-containing protein
MTDRPKYPRDVVVEFLREDESYRSIYTHVFGQAPVPVQDDSVLERLVETMFFASMATEEGRIEPVGIVFAESVDAFTSTQSLWDIITIRSPLRFTAREVTKLASICDFKRSFLAVVLQADDLKIVGIATPHSRTILPRDGLIRVLAPRPGTIVLYRGGWEFVRYERGFIRQSPPNYLTSKAAQKTINSIAQAVFGLFRANDELFQELSRIVAEVSHVGHGGIIAVLGPTDAPEPLLQEACALSAPIPLGEALRVYQELRRASMHTDPTQETLEDKERVEKASNRLGRLRQQLVRLTSVDGAVLLSHSLDVLAFGVKLAIEHAPSLEVFSANNLGEPGDRWSLDLRGTRHRAAAAFAKTHPNGFAFIVSQDGDAALFQSCESKVVHWPLRVPIALDSK